MSQPIEAPFDACPDGGRCWHYCLIGDDGKGLPCWRVQACAPFTGQYPDEPDGYWPEEIRRQHQRARNEFHDRDG